MAVGAHKMYRGDTCSQSNLLVVTQDAADAEKKTPDQYFEAARRRVRKGCSIGGLESGEFFELRSWSGSCWWSGELSGRSDVEILDGGDQGWWGREGEIDDSEWPEWHAKAKNTGPFELRFRG